jgi:hypothetical protein
MDTWCTRRPLRSTINGVGVVPLKEVALAVKYRWHRSKDPAMHSAMVMNRSGLCADKRFLFISQS